MLFGLLGVIRKNFAHALLLGVFIAISFASILIPAASAAPGINQQMNFQGRLMNANGSIVPDGNYNMQFKIYQGGTGTAAGNPGGSLSWTESWLNSGGNGVTVRNGYISVQLGSITPFGTNVNWNDDTLWLSMNIGNTNLTCSTFALCAPDGEMVPMKRLSATPYALNAGMVGGMKATDFLLIGKGVQADPSNLSSIFVNKTGTGHLVQLQSGGVDVYNVTNTGDIVFGGASSHSISVAASTSGAGKMLTVSAGSASTSGAAAQGGELALRGGNAAGTGNANGGNVSIMGGMPTGTGVQGLVNMGASSFMTGTQTPCAVDCTVNQSLVDTYSTVVVSASETPITITLPAPTINTQGRILYITTASGSKDFTLEANTGTNLLEVTMKQNTTATMVWNGTAWTPGGASNAITLQATYNNATNPSTTPEIKLDSIRGTIDIQDADTSIGADLFNIRASNATGLGTVLFGVSNTGRVTIQGTTDDSSAFRVMNLSGNYLFNINSTNGYVISNSIKTPGNELVNPGFEAGGELMGGEEGWSGPAQGAIASDGNARTGNYQLSVTASGNLDFYNGSYYEVTPGDMLYLSGYMKATAGAVGNGGVALTWYNKDKSPITSYQDVASPTTTYALRTLNMTVPAGASYARVSAAVRAGVSGTFYFDDFYLKKNSEQAPMTYRNDVDSTTAFRLQSAGGAQTLLTANTAGNNIKIGDNDSNATVLILDNVSSDPAMLTGRNGGLFYNTTTNSFKAIVNGVARDICVANVACDGYAASAGMTVALQSNGSEPGSQQSGFLNISGIGYMTGVQTIGGGALSSNLTIKTGNATSVSGNILIDTGTAGTNRGSITVGTSGVGVTMGGNLAVQGSNSLSLGLASTNSGSILFANSAGANTVTLRAPASNPSTSYTLTLPTNLGGAGECIKTDASGNMYFQGCGVGVNFNLQDAYNNSDTPATVMLSDGKDLKFVAQNTTETDPNILVDLQCTGTCTSGRFAVQQNGADVLTVLPNSGDIVLNSNKVQIGSATTDSGAPKLLQLDSSTVSTGSEGVCGLSVNQGAMYYNTSMGSLRACINGSWGDVSNPDTLGLLTFGIVPSSGGANNSYDLPSLITPSVSGPCKVSRIDNNTVQINNCAAYSNGRRVTVNAGNLCFNKTNTTGCIENITMSATNTWAHICLNPNTGQPSFYSHADGTGSTSALEELPAFSVTNPILCLADVRTSTATVGAISAIYDVRTFTSTMKEAVNSGEAVELGMMTDTNVNGSMKPAEAASKKLYGAVVATDGATSAGAPNSIVATVGPSWVKAIAGSPGAFVITSTTPGYARTNTSIPNNSFYYSAGNTRTGFGLASTATTNICSTAANCAGSLYVNFVVR